MVVMAVEVGRAVSVERIAVGQREGGGGGGIMCAVESDLSRTCGGMTEIR